MWRTQTSRKGRHIINAARQLATESAPPPKPNLPPPIPPPPPKSGGGTFLKIIGLSLPVAVGGVVGYAWYDQDFRKQLEDNIPYAKEALETILPENEKAVPASREQKQELSSVLQKASKLNVQEEVAKGSVVQPVSNKDAPSSDKRITTALDKSSEKKDDRIDPSAVDLQIRRRDEDERADNAALEVVIHKLSINSQNLTEEAVKAQHDVASAIRNHTKLLKQAMDDTSDILQKDAQWEAVAIANKEKEHASLRANELVTESKKNIEKLRDVLAEGKGNKVTQHNPAIVPASKLLNDLLKELGTANLQVRQAEGEANVMQKYKDLIDKGRKQFQQELESLMPSAKLSSGKKLSEDELNVLIAHAHRRIEQLQKQVAEQLAMERQRLGTALEAQRQEDIRITDAAVAEERLRLQGELDAERSKQEMEFLVRMETEIRKQLSRQAAAHSDHLKDVLAIQHEQLSADFNRVLNLKLLEEREKFQTEVAGWISRLKGIEAAIDARATSEKLARCAQDLWLACIALNSVIHFGSESDEAQLVPLRSRVEAILQAGNKHPFVETVANTIPVEALDRGLSTEDELRTRFTRVSRICRRVGLVNAGNMSLYKFLISYLHSFVVFDHITASSEKEEVDLSSMDNFALLAHANYWMEKGNLDLALRFMIQLTGEPRRAANGWIKEALLFLETKQSAYTLTAYASATGLANTF